ncbi:monocarboxylate transporter 3-like [Ylistrum balloti]|uniref:monocarboxylate transporter 3-like n=1 Tax=Ylistrum balloti TaxID=509963 RepID=UPI002905A316|nr:monocarboxylate transporter 3-like [Ylistrum balloti]
MTSPERALIDNVHGDQEQLNENLISKKDSRYSWFVCACGFVMQVFILGVHHAFGVFFVEFIKEFKVSKSQAAWVGSVAYGLSMTFGPVVGILLKRWGNRKVMMTGAFICAISIFASSFVVRLSQLFGTFSLMYGIGTCMCTQPTMTIGPTYFDRHLSVAIGLMTAGSSVGTLVMAPLSQCLIDNIGWRNTFRVFTGTCLCCALCGAFILPLDGIDKRPAMTSESVDISTFRRVLRELRLWKNRVFIVWTLSITSVMFGFYIPYVHLVSYAEDIGISPDQGSIFVMLLGASTAIGRISFGKIVQLGFLNRIHMHQISMVITGTGVMLLPMIKTFSGIVAYVIVVGLVDGCYVVLLPVLTTSLMGPENTVLAWCFLVGTSSITFTLGPPIAGALYDLLGSYDVAFHCAGIPVIGGAVILFFIPWAQRTNTVYEIPSYHINECAVNEYDFTDDLLYGPRDTIPIPSSSTLNSESVAGEQSGALHMLTPTRGIRTSMRSRAKSYRDQSTATSPGSTSLIPMDVQNALEQLDKTRQMLEQMLSRDREDRSKRSVSELIQTQTRREHTPSNAVSIMSVPVGLHMSCCRCRQEQHGEEPLGEFGRDCRDLLSPTSTTQLSMGSSFQSRNLSDYQVNTDVAGATAGYHTTGCLSPERKAHLLCPGRLACPIQHGHCTHERQPTHTDIADKCEGEEFDRAVRSQVENLRGTLLSPSRNPLFGDSKEDLRRESASDFQLIDQSDLESATMPVITQDTTSHKRESIHRLCSPKLEVIEEVPVNPTHADNALANTEPSSEAVETWLRNSPNCTQISIPIDSEDCLSGNESSPNTEVTAPDTASNRSSPGGEIDVFTHLFDDNVDEDDNDSNK